MGSPSVPEAPPAPPPPALPIDPAVLERRRRARRGRGRGQQTLLTGPTGVTTPGTISFPTLLGGGGAAGSGAGI